MKIRAFAECKVTVRATETIRVAPGETPKPLGTMIACQSVILGAILSVATSELDRIGPIPESASSGHTDSA